MAKMLRSKWFRVGATLFAMVLFTVMVVWASVFFTVRHLEARGYGTSGTSVPGGVLTIGNWKLDGNTTQVLAFKYGSNERIRFEESGSGADIDVRIAFTDADETERIWWDHGLDAFRIGDMAYPDVIKCAGAVQADTYLNLAGTGAPSFTYGLSTASGYGVGVGTSAPSTNAVDFYCADASKSWRVYSHLAQKLQFLYDGNARFQFEESGSAADIDAKFGFYDDDEGPESIAWDDGLDAFLISDTVKSSNAILSSDGYYGVNTATSAAFPQGIPATGFDWDAGNVKFIDVSGASNSPAAADDILYVSSSRYWDGGGTIYGAILRASSYVRSDTYRDDTAAAIWASISSGDVLIKPVADGDYVAICDYNSNERLKITTNGDESDGDVILTFSGGDGETDTITFDNGNDWFALSDAINSALFYGTNIDVSGEVECSYINFIETTDPGDPPAGSQYIFSSSGSDGDIVVTFDDNDDLLMGDNPSP